MKIKLIRHIIQIAFLALLVVPSLFYGTIWVGTFISSDLLGIGITDPFTALEITLAGKELWGTLFISAIPLTLLGILFGRVFCSFVCPLNLLLEILPFKKKKPIGDKLLPVYSLVIFLLAALVASVPVFNVLSPQYELMRVILFGVGIELAVVALVVGAAAIWGQKIWCRTLCPLGAAYGVLGAKKRLVLKVDKAKCTSCGQCAAVCSMGTRPGKTDFANAITCTNCGDCIGVCHTKAISYSLGGKQE